MIEADSFRPGGGQPVERYFSRRNRVWSVREREGLLVVKEHATARRAAREHRILTGLAAAGVAVPRPLALEGRKLYLRHLPGLLLAEIVEQNLLPQAAWTESLAQWYRTLHEATRGSGGSTRLKTDNNLRNFIYQEGAFFGLDFEESSRGNPARDIGQVCAFILADRPAFTAAKRAAAAALVRCYLAPGSILSPEQIEAETLRELKKMARRRKDERDLIRSFIASILSAGEVLFPR